MRVRLGGGNVQREGSGESGNRGCEGWESGQGGFDEDGFVRQILHSSGVMDCELGDKTTDSQ